MKNTVHKSSLELQSEVQAVISVIGVPDWRSCLDFTITLNDPMWQEICGGKEVPLIHYLKKEAEVNGVSFERSVANAFINKGYVLQELEVEFSHPEKRGWGRSIWYKEHPEYGKKIESILVSDPSKIAANFWNAMFKTEHAGDQHFGLFSTQMLGAALVGQGSGVLLHKAMVYHKITFSKLR